MTRTNWTVWKMTPVVHSSFQCASVDMQQDHILMLLKNDILYQKKWNFKINFAKSFTILMKKNGSIFCLHFSAPNCCTFLRETPKSMWTTATRSFYIFLLVHPKKSLATPGFLSENENTPQPPKIGPVPIFKLAQFIFF